MPNPSISSPTRLWACGYVTGATGAVSGQSNVASVVRNGAGDYTVTLTEGIPIANRTIKVTPVNAAGRSATIDADAAGSFDVLMWDLAVPGAADSDFYFEITRKADI